MPTLTLASGNRIHVQIAGPENAPAVVLSNSIGTNTRLWDPIVEALAARYRVIRYDSRGHGGSSTPPGEYLISDLASDVVAILDSLGVASAHFVGISIGGQTGLAFALEHPTRLGRLVVANTGAKIGTEQSWAARAATVREDGLDAIKGLVVSGWLTPPFAGAHPELVAELHSWFLGNDPEGYARTCHALGEADFRDALPRIAAPTLVISGADDVPTPPELTGQIATFIPEAQHITIPGAHLSVLESPTEFANAVLAHIDE